MWSHGPLDRNYLALVESHGLNTVFENEFLGDIGAREPGSKVYLGFVSRGNSLKTPHLVEAIEIHNETRYATTLKRAFKRPMALLVQWQESRTTALNTKEDVDGAYPVIAVRRHGGDIVRAFRIPPSPN